MSVVNTATTAYRGVMGDSGETLGTLVQERMRRRGVTPRDLANAIHRSESTVSLLLRDKVGTPPPEVVAALATYLDIDERRLLRLIGYLSTVQEVDQPRPLIYPPDDPRHDLLAALPDLTPRQVRNLRRLLLFVLEDEME